MNQVYLDNRRLGQGQILKNAIRMVFPDLIEKQIPIGDLVCGNACIEFKTVPDFIGSIKNEHLRVQTIHMIENFEHPIILVFGSYSDLFSQIILDEIIYEETGNNQIKPIYENGIIGAIASLEVRYGITTWFLNPVDARITSYLSPLSEYSQKYSMRVLDYISKHNPYIHICNAMKYFFEKSNDGKIANMNPLRRGPTIKERQIFVLTSYPGISQKRASDLLNYFITIKNVLNADKKELMKVKGIGKKTADEIISITTQDYK